MNTKIVHQGSFVLGRYVSKIFYGEALVRSIISTTSVEDLSILRSTPRGYDVWEAKIKDETGRTDNLEKKLIYFDRTRRIDLYVESRDQEPLMMVRREQDELARKVLWEYVASIERKKPKIRNTKRRFSLTNLFRRYIHNWIEKKK